MNIEVKENQYFVVLAEINTGIVVNSNGLRNLTKNTPFQIFNDIKSAEEYSSQKVIELPDIECNIYNSKSQRIKVIKKN